MTLITIAPGIRVLRRHPDRDVLIVEGLGEYATLFIESIPGGWCVVNGEAATKRIYEQVRQCEEGGMDNDNTQHITPLPCPFCGGRTNRAQAERDELRLTLAAEQGKSEGAPTGWQWQVAEPQRGRWREWLTGRWIKPHPEGGMLAAHLEYLGPGSWRWSTPRNDRSKGEEPTARAAMLAADKAIFEPRRARCLAKARQLQADGVVLYPPNGTHQQTPAIMIDRLSDPDLTEAVLSVYEKVLFP